MTRHTIDLTADMYMLRVRVSMGLEGSSRGGLRFFARRLKWRKCNRADISRRDEGEKGEGVWVLSVFTLFGFAGRSHSFLNHGRAPRLLPLLFIGLFGLDDTNAALLTWSEVET